MMKLSALFKTKENIFYSFKPLYYLLKFFSMAPYKLESRGTDDSSTVIDKIFLLVSIAFWNLIATLQIRAALENPSFFRSSDFLSKIHILESIMQLYFCIVLMIFNFVRRKRCCQFLDHLHKFDEKLRNLHWPYSVENSRVYYILVVMYILICLMSTVSASLFSTLDLTSIVLYVANGFLFLTVSCQFFFQHFLCRS